MEEHHDNIRSENTICKKVSFNRVGLGSKVAPDSVRKRVVEDPEIYGPSGETSREEARIDIQNAM